jgi:hypothetical protein
MVSTASMATTVSQVRSVLKAQRVLLERRVTLLSWRMARRSWFRTLRLGTLDAVTDSLVT